MESCLLAALLILGLTGAIQGSDVVYTGTRVVPAGDEIRVDCTNPDQETIAWTKDGHVVSGFGVKVNSRPNKGSELIIEKARADQSGVYKCTALSTKGFSVRVVETGSDVVYDGPEVAVPGQEVTITCFARETDNLQWKKDGSDVPAGVTAGRIRILPNRAKVATLTIYKTRLDHAGVYTCVNGVNKEYALHVLNIMSEDTVQMSPGSKLVVPCKTDIPGAEFSWTFNGQTINPDNKEYMQNQDGLVVQKAECKHAGTYTCQLEEPDVDMADHDMLNKTIQVQGGSTCGACSIYTTTSLLVVTGALCVRMWGGAL